MLNDGSVVCVWADMYGEKDGYYTFDVLADASPEEQVDPQLVISGDTPARPEQIIFTVAKIPAGLVANVLSRGWDTPVEPDDLVPTEWRPRPTNSDS